jgi:hypothetical protein
MTRMKKEAEEYLNKVKVNADKKSSNKNRKEFQP